MKAFLGSTLNHILTFVYTSETHPCRLIHSSYLTHTCAVLSVLSYPSIVRWVQLSSIFYLHKHICFKFRCRLLHFLQFKKIRKEETPPTEFYFVFQLTFCSFKYLRRLANLSIEGILAPHYLDVHICFYLSWKQSNGGKKF